MLEQDNFLVDTFGVGEEIEVLDIVFIMRGASLNVIKMKAIRIKHNLGRIIKQHSIASIRQLISHTILT